MIMAIKVTNFSQETKTWRTLPPQKVPYSTKQTDAWKQANVDAIISMAQSSEANRTSRYNKQVNYDLVNSRFKQEDFMHVLNPYGLKDARFTGSATKLQNYNIIRTPFETLKGEEMKLGMEFRAIAVNGEATLQKNSELSEAVKNAIRQRAMAVATDDIDPETGEPNAPDPVEVANSFRTEYAHPTEIAANKLLKFLVHQDLLQMKFSKGWEHALTSAEEIYYSGIVKGHPSVRACNPLNISYDKESDEPFIQNGDWAVEERWMPVGAVIDLFGDELSEEEVKKLDSGEFGGRGSYNSQYPGFAYRFEGGTSMYGGAPNSSHVYVATVAWRSYRKLGKLSYIDERTGMLESVIVDESFKMTPELKATGAQIIWYHETEIWEGTKVGDFYVGIRPRENQTGKLPYVGYVYNNINSIATSLIDMIKPHQYTYIIVWYRLEQELAKAKGKKFLMDLAQLPKSKGWTTDQWMYYFDNLGVIWVNSLEEGRQGDPNTVSKFNQFQAIDMTLSQSVNQYMQILQKLEQMVETISGVSPQRAGNIASNETATGAQRAIIQSTNNTKPLFFYHDMVRKEVLQELIELCKVAYADGADITYPLDEKTVETIKFDAGFLNGTELGVFMSNAFEDAENLQKLEQYLGMALQYDKTNLSDIVSVLGTKSLSEVRDTIVGGERDKQARDQQAQQAQAEEAQKAREAMAEEAELQREFTRELEHLKSDTAIKVAEIQAEARIKDDDSELRAEIAERQLTLAERKFDLEAENSKEELRIKEKIANSKKRE